MIWVFLAVMVVGAYKDFTDPEERKRRERKARHWYRCGMNRYPTC
jgi:hypothetical protein